MTKKGYKQTQEHIMKRFQHCKRNPDRHNPNSPYNTWINMRSRCNNKNNPDYKYYGNRNISICEEWNDYIIFKQFALSHGWKKGKTLNRINNNLGYNPTNCEFITLHENVKQRNIDSGNPSRKLNTEKATEIRRLYQSGIHQKDIAKLYGISQTNVSKIVLLRTYNDKFGD